jgi:hypothetical protein
MVGLSSWATYRPGKDHFKEVSGGPAACPVAYDHVVATCAGLIESGRVRHNDPEVLAGLWSMVHGFVTLELSDHFADFDDPVTSVFLPLGKHTWPSDWETTTRVHGQPPMRWPPRLGMMPGDHGRHASEVAGLGPDKEETSDGSVRAGGLGRQGRRSVV